MKWQAIQPVTCSWHAEMLLVTGAASRRMQAALKRAYDATREPKFVIAVGGARR